MGHVQVLHSATSVGFRDSSYGARQCLSPIPGALGTSAVGLQIVLATDLSEPERRVQDRLQQQRVQASVERVSSFEPMMAGDCHMCSWVRFKPETGRVLFNALLNGRGCGRTKHARHFDLTL